MTMEKEFKVSIDEPPKSKWEKSVPIIQAIAGLLTASSVVILAFFQNIYDKGSDTRGIFIRFQSNKYIELALVNTGNEQSIVTDAYLSFPRSGFNRDHVCPNSDDYNKLHLSIGDEVKNTNNPSLTQTKPFLEVGKMSSTSVNFVASGENRIQVKLTREQFRRYLEKQSHCVIDVMVWESDDNDKQPMSVVVDKTACFEIFAAALDLTPDVSQCGGKV